MLAPTRPLPRPGTSTPSSGNLFPSGTIAIVTRRLELSSATAAKRVSRPFPAGPRLSPEAGSATSSDAAGRTAERPRARRCRNRRDAATRSALPTSLLVVQTSSRRLAAWPALGGFRSACVTSQAGDTRRRCWSGRGGALTLGSCFASERKPADAGRAVAGEQRARASGLSDPGVLVPGAARRQVSSWTDGAASRVATRRQPVSCVHGVGPARLDSVWARACRSSSPLAPLVQDRVDLVTHVVAGASAVNS